MRIQSDGWIYGFDNEFAMEFLTSLGTDALATEATLTQYCVNCVAITRTDCQIDISDLSATG